MQIVLYQASISIEAETLADDLYLRTLFPLTGSDDKITISAQLKYPDPPFEGLVGLHLTRVTPMEHVVPTIPHDYKRTHMDAGDSRCETCGGRPYHAVFDEDSKQRWFCEDCFTAASKLIRHAGQKEAEEMLEQAKQKRRDGGKS